MSEIAGIKKEEVGEDKRNKRGNKKDKDGIRRL